MSNLVIKDLGHTGICIKSKDTIVEYQNSACEKICGNQIGKKCEKGCVLKINANESDQVFKTGFKLFRNIPVDANNVDSVIFNDGEKVITLLVNNQENIQQQLNLIKKYKLSAAELNIIKKFLEGTTNAEIAKELFISKATLRTHLNNIYKKIPSELKNDILSSHFGKNTKLKKND
ncbi:MAG: helix-turn-helix transcriptional regulator [Bdellovibrionota bacterium]